MSFDGLMLRRVVALLKEQILDCQVNKISQVTANDFVFNLFKPTLKTNLLISINNNASYLTLSSLRYQDNLEAKHFSKILRQHLEGARIKDIKQLGLDRLVGISFRKQDELGEITTKHLYIELTGKMTNIILAKEDNSIIDCFHRLGPITKRTIMPGAIYQPPPAPSLKDPLVDPYNPNDALSGQFYGFSKNLEQEVRYRLNKGEKLNNIMQELLSSSTVYCYKNDYHLIPFTHLKEEPKLFKWDEGLVNFYLDYQQKVKKDEALRDLRRLIKRESKKYNTKIEHLESELEKAGDSEKFRKYADLIYTYGEDLKLKKEELKLTLEDYDEPIIIPLDERFNLKENAQKFYKRYQKLQNSKEILKNQIALAKDEYEYFELLKIQIEDASKNELEQIKQELAEQNYLKLPSKKSRKKVTSYLPHTYYGPDNVKISVGMNNFQNDYLTHKLAKYNEYFFHVKDYPGSHVVVHSSEKLSEKLIRYAANLAAYFSKARYSSTVPVNYTLVKEVKKHPSNKPGLVLLKTYKTIYIDPKKVEEN